MGSTQLARTEPGHVGLELVRQLQEARLRDVQALQFMAEWVGEQEGGHITIFKDFGAASLAEASAELLFKSAPGGKISGETYFNELQRRGILSPDLDWETEQERIQSAPPDLVGA